jgi:hypothetical protein
MLSAMVAAPPAAWGAVLLDAPAPVAPVAPVSLPSDAAELAGRAFVRDRLVRLGRSPAAADDAVRRLSAEDVAVLLANPKMLQRAGSMDVGTEVAIGTILIICVFVGLALGGATVVIISG